MSFTNIDAETLERLRDGGGQVIDVRSDAEVARGVIPGAKQIAMDKIASRLGELDTTAPLVIYCQTGARSASVAQFLVSQGFQRVNHLQGGIMAWAAGGRPVGELAGKQVNAES
jgi:rhodanese-related sulfurtransferase